MTTSTTCGWCGRFTTMEAATDVRVGREVQPVGYRLPYVLTAAYCCSFCNRLSVARIRDTEPSRGNLAEWFESRDEQLQWSPAAVELREFSDVPPQIAGAAREVHAILSIGAWRSAVLMARAVVEATAKFHGISNGNLQSKIGVMEQRSLIRPLVRDAAHEVRQFGNEIAHGDFVEDVPTDEAEEAVALMDMVLHEVFQEPAQVERLVKARQERNQDAT